MPFFNVFCPLRLTSAFDAAILERSINEIVRRHDILRTTFATVDNRCMQIIAPCLAVKLTFDDLSVLPASKRKTVGHLLLQEEALHSFDLSQGPLLDSSRALGGAGASPAHHDARDHRRRLVAWRSRGGTLRSIRCILGLRSAIPGTAVNSICGLCAVAEKLAVASGDRCAARVLARAASRSTARDETSHGSAGTGHRQFANGAPGGDVAGEPVGGCQIF